jgi:hypothetical protein
MAKTKRRLKTIRSWNGVPAFRSEKHESAFLGDAPER